jgi:hypothetical protein
MAKSDELTRARALVERLPDRIRVGAHDFAIQKWNASQAAGARRWGECSTCELRIAIQLDMPTRIKAMETFVHEAEHAIWWVWCVQDEDKEERTVNLMATGWTCVYRDNPWLLDWLKEAVT